jgi:hypothetical protein
MSGRSCVYEGNYSCFTTSFGDVTTATGLAAAVVAALSHRLRTNKGFLMLCFLVVFEAATKRATCFHFAVEARLLDDVV